jgi:phosphoribosylformimino-5-aminoimidazole carboxamide ribotide isomerase
MILYPAMDLIGGRAVRLQQGRFDEVTTFPEAPAEALRRFAAAGAQWAHLVDLDGARVGAPVQHELIATLAAEAPLRLQVAGGFRERAELARLFSAGVERIVIGSLAVCDPERVRSWIDEFGAERIAVALDIRLIHGTPLVAISGWSEDSGRTLWEVAADHVNARHFLVTDIGRDGMLEGPNVGLYEEIVRRLPSARVQASGGITTLADLNRLPTAGAIIGKALWTGRMKLEEALVHAGA